MAEITAALVKELRDKTGAGMMDCKQALGESAGDIEAAVATPISPSAATRPAFFAAAARPFLRSQSTAASMSPSVSPSARLQSIIPAPVLSRNSLTSVAVTSAIFP